MSIEDLINELNGSKTDPIYENEVAKVLANANTEDVGKLLSAYLNHEKYQVRMMGLRLIKRCVTDKDLLSELANKCFEVNRLTELQNWYSAILSRYPAALFISSLKIELERRRDLSFFEKHFRALQVEFANGGEKERKYLAEIHQCRPK